MSVAKYTPPKKLSNDIRNAEKLAENLDTEIYHLIHYLKSALNEVERMEATDKETISKRLSSLLDKAEDIGLGAGKKVAGGVKELWDETKGLLGRKIPTAAEETWENLFSSYEWKRFFMRHPNLDPTEWQEYFRESAINPANWQETLEQSISKITPKTFGRYEYPSLAGPEVYAPNTCFMAALSIFYLFYILSRAMRTRANTAIFLGDGTAEIIQAEGDEQKGKRFADSDSIKRNLDVIRHFVAVVPVCLFSLYLLELNGIGFWIYCGIAGVLTSGLLLTNEWSIISPANAYMRPLGDLVLRYSLLIVGCACLVSNLFQWITYFES